MRCPKCQSPADDWPTSAGVTLNFCRGCKGLWFDAGELSRYCQAERVTRSLPSRLKTARQTSLPCPRCPDTLLSELPYWEGGDLLIDCCPACHGIWLDAGELLRVQQHICREQAPPGTEPVAPSAAGELDWRQICGWIGTTLLVVGAFLPFLDHDTTGLLSFAALLVRSYGAVLGPGLLAALGVIPLVLTYQRQYGWLGMFGLGVSALLTLSQVIPFLIEKLELWPPAFLEAIAWSPQYGVDVLLFGAGHLLLANTPAGVIRRLSRTIAGRQVQITLCDASDERCLEHLEPLLVALQNNDKKFQADQSADWCVLHHCRMHVYLWDGRLYWRHRLENGQWCARKAADA